MVGKKIKIAEEETLRSSITVNHYKSGRRRVFGVKGNSVNESTLIAGGTKPPNITSFGSRPYINIFLSIGSPGVESKPSRARNETSIIIKYYTLVLLKLSDKLRLLLDSNSIVK